MRKHHKPWKFLKKRWLPLLAGGMALQTMATNTGGCDPQLKTTFLTGIQTTLAATATGAIQSIFTNLLSSDGSTTNGSTSQTGV